MSRYIWVDMVCINQEDIHERNAQIRTMGRIFESASIVFGWLGPEANLSRRAGAAMAHVLDKAFEAHTTKVTDFDKFLPPDIKALFCVEGVTEVDVYAIFALLQRLWFRRAWIIQEAVLAKKLIIVCGGVMLQWGGIELFVSLLHSRNLFRALSTFATGIMSGGPTYKDGKQHRKLGFDSVFSLLGDESVGQWNGDLQVDPLESQDFINGVGTLRRLFGREVVITGHVKNGKADAGETLTASGNHLTEIGDDPAGFKEQPNSKSEELIDISEEPLTAVSGWRETLLHVCRSCAASDPRDKIFSLFGILEKTGSQIPDIIWDYRTPAHDLYRVTVLAIIRVTKRLDILAQVQDPSRTKLPGLPSWVPDFSVSLGAAQFENFPHTYFSAAGTRSHCAPPTAGIALRLPVEGFFIDNIIDVAALKGCYFLRTAKIVARLPPRYHPKGRLTNKSPARSQAYWSTLVGALTNDDGDPATAKIGFGFSEWIIEELVRAYSQQKQRQRMRDEQLIKGKIHHESPSVQKYFKMLSEKFLLWIALTRGEPEEYIHVDTVNDSEVYISPETQLRFIPDETTLYTYLSQETTILGMYPVAHKYPESAYKAAFMARKAEMKRGHRMFRTPNNYLGMGPISSQVGDEIWVLKGSRVPFILRRKGTGQYQLIGEAYVHGIMHGEAVEGNFKPTSLELV